MLILGRKVGQTIIIDNWLRITVLKIQEQAIELGLEDRFKKISLQNISVSFGQKVQIFEGVSILVWAKTKKGPQVALGIDTSPYTRVLREELVEESREVDVNVND